MTYRRSSRTEPTYLRFSVNNDLGPLEDGVEGGGTGRGHAQPHGLAAWDLEIEVVRQKHRLAACRRDIHKVVAALIGVRAVLRAGHRADDNAYVLDRLSRL